MGAKWGLNRGLIEITRLNWGNNAKERKEMEKKMLRKKRKIPRPQPKVRLNSSNEVFLGSGKENFWHPSPQESQREV